MKKITLIFSLLLIVSTTIYASENKINGTFNINTSNIYTKYVVFPIPDEIYYNVNHIESVWITGNDVNKNVPYLIYTEKDYKTSNNLPIYKTLNLDYTINENDIYNETTITINNLKNRNATALNFNILDEYFSRDVKGSILLKNTNSLVKMDDISNLNLDTKNMTLYENIKLKIKNNDNEPLDIKNISATVLQNYIVFEDKGEQYTLHFNSSSNNLKKYDISSFKEEILQNKIDIAKTENFQIKNEDNIRSDLKQPNFNINVDLIFNILLVIIVAVVGSYGALTIVQKKK